MRIGGRLLRGDPPVRSSGGSWLSRVRQRRVLGVASVVAAAGLQLLRRCGVGLGAGAWGSGVTRVGDAENGGSFVFGQPAPDAVGFSGLQSPGGAFGDDGAGPADGFGPGDPLGLLVAAFASGVVEDFDVHAATGGEDLPVPFLGDGASRSGLEGGA